jgi:FG-GAP repeat
MSLFPLFTVTVAMALGGVSAAASPTAAYQPCAAGAPAGVDFNGDRAPDAAVGVPGRRVGGVGEAGLVEVRYGGGAGEYALTAASPTANANLGRALQPADLNGDVCTDLLAGAPFRDVDGTDDSGAVFVFLGTPSGFHEAGLLRPGAGGVPGRPDSFAYFGWVLGLDRSVVYVGEPCAVGPDREGCAGAVTRLRLTISETGGVTAAGTRFMENSPLVGGTIQGGEEFGSSFASLDGKMAIGAPGDGPGGSVFVVGGTGPARKLTQDTPGMPGAAEPGDAFGTMLSTHAGSLVVGSPQESIGTAEYAGMITLVPVSAGALRPDRAIGYSQNSFGVAGAAEPGDRFGAAVATWDTSLLVGAPGETVGTVAEAGMVSELGTGRGWTQNTSGIPGDAAVDAQFGSRIGSIGGNPLVGVPGADTFRGAVILLGKVSYLWTLSSGSSHEFQEYGLAIS